MFKKFKSIWFMYNPIINIEIAELEKIRCLVTDIWFWMETTINWNEFGIFMFFCKNVSSFNRHFVRYEHILPRNNSLLFVLREKNVLFTFSDHNIDMGKGDNSEMFYAHWLTVCNDSKFTFACSISSSDVFHIFHQLEDHWQ